MRFKIQCDVCGKVIWIRGIEEEDVNATCLDDDDENWADACEHIEDSRFTIVDSESVD